MSVDSNDSGHGHSPAAWTAVVVMLAAVLIGTVAFFFALEWLVWASVVVLLLGLVAGWLLARAGYGAGGAKVAARDH
jgi:hypothetical protein